MVNIPFDCPACGGGFEIDASAAGCQTTCPACGQALIVPEAPLPPEPPAVAPPPVSVAPPTVSVAPPTEPPPSPEGLAAPALSPPPGPSGAAEFPAAIPSADPTASAPLAAPVVGGSAPIPVGTTSSATPLDPLRPRDAGTAPDAGDYTLREPAARTVTRDGRVMELRRLTPEERAATRFRRNLILITGGIIFLGIVGALLLRYG